MPVLREIVSHPVGSCRLCLPGPESGFRLCNSIVVFSNTCGIPSSGCSCMSSYIWHALTGQATCTCASSCSGLLALYTTRLFPSDPPLIFSSFPPNETKWCHHGHGLSVSLWEFIWGV